MKIGNLYDLDAFKAFKDSAAKQGFNDSYAGTILERHLTVVNPKIFEKKYPDLALFTAGITADNTGGYGQVVQSLRLVEQGAFAQAGDASGNKGKISLSAEDSTIKVKEFSAESNWSDTEIKQAEMGGVNLPGRYIENHNKIYMREIDEAGLVGVGSQAGLLNYAGFASTAAAGAIATLTAQEMYDEIAGLINAQWNAVNNTAEYKANKVITSITVMNFLQSTMMDTTAGTESVLRALQGNFAGVDFIGSFRAEDGGTGGASATVAFNSGEDVMSMRIPQPLRIGEIIKLGSFDFKIDSKYRVAGLDILEDTGGYILTGL